MKRLLSMGGFVLGWSLLLTPSSGAGGPLVPFRPGGPAATAPRWPTVAEQLARDGVRPGSALERLILAHQNFALLAPGEAGDGNPIPPWLRVLWREKHPEGRYRASDPTGGYPLVLREIHEWLLTHQDLQRGSEPAALAERAAPTESGEERISGLAATPRSESAIRVNPADPGKIVAASNDIGGSGAMAVFYSTDGGVTWGQSALPLAADDLFQSDPAVEWTSDGTAWATAIAVSSLFSLRARAYRSTDNGATWVLDATVSGSETQADKEMIRVDASPGSPYKDNLYVVWHDGFSALFARRSGGRWQNPVLVGGTETTGTPIGGDVATNSAGDVFAFWPDTDSLAIYVVKSTDGGLSFGPARKVAGTFGSFQVGIPADNQRGVLLYTTAAAYRTANRDEVYAAWNDLSGESACGAFFLSPGTDAGNPCKTRIWFARSVDGGATWSAPAKIADPRGHEDQFFPWLTIDPATGRLGIVYYDTVRDASRRTTQLLYQSSDDGGLSWTAPFQVTHAATDETVSGADSGNQYGDYIGLSFGGGLFYPSWTDRRNGAREEIWTAAIHDPAACSAAAISDLTATPKGTAGVALGWSAVPGATCQVFRAGRSGGPYSLVATTTASGWFDAAGPCDTTHYYTVRALGSCPSALSNEVAYAERPSVVVYSDDFESGGGLSGWTVGALENLGPTTDWFGTQSCRAHSGSHSFRFGSPSCSGGATPGDLLSAQPGGVNGIALPAGSSLTKLSFWQSHDFQPGAAGGLLLFEVSGGPLFLVPKQSLSGETYSLDQIGSLCSPTRGTEVFTGTSAGFAQTTVDFDSDCTAVGAPGCGGANLVVGFTASTDCGPPQGGWYLDDVVLTTCPAAPAAPALGFFTLPPCRLLDTRNPPGPGGGPTLAAQATRAVTAAGRCGVPATARAISVNVTAVSPAAAGSLNLFADDQPAPATSIVNFAPGQVRSNNAVVSLGNGTGGLLAVNGSLGKVDLVIDVNGYFE